MMQQQVFCNSWIKLLWPKGLQTQPRLIDTLDDKKIQDPKDEFEVRKFIKLIDN